MKKNLPFFILCIVSAFFNVFISCSNSPGKSNARSSDLSNYNFKRTKILVEKVRKGAEILQNKGVEALREYEKTSDQNDIYFYVYSINDALCIYHSEDSTKINTIVTDQTDFLGKPIQKLIVEAVNDTIDNPDAWVHFNWPRPDNIFPTWKSACHRRVKMKDGREVFIGAGMYGYMPEREFIRISVNKACHLISQQGDSALEYIQSPKSPFVFFDCFVFIYDFDGKSIIDPSYIKDSKLNLLTFQDATNHQPFKALAEQLQVNDAAWNTLQFTSPESMNIRKKMIYCRKARLNNTDVIVGSMMDAPQAIWFK